MAKKKLQLKLKVTKKHILEGEGGDENTCAIALCAVEALKALGFADDIEVSVNAEDIHLYGTKQEHKAITCTLNTRVKTPKVASKFIETFDDAKDEQVEVEEDENGYMETRPLTDAELLKKVKPIEFTVNL